MVTLNGRFPRVTTEKVNVYNNKNRLCLLRRPVIRARKNCSNALQREVLDIDLYIIKIQALIFKNKDGIIDINLFFS